MITLTLLHPIQSIPVQSWTFEHEPVIRIGRSTDNHVILYSAVVSRHHVELRQAHSGWEIVNLGANGTYLDGKRITQVPVFDGVIIRLARSGPNIQIHISSEELGTRNQIGASLLAQRMRLKVAEAVAEKESKLPVQAGDTDLSLPVHQSDSDHDLTSAQAGFQESGSAKSTVDIEDRINGETPLSPPHHTDIDANPCSHPRASGGVLFCPDCGQPLQVLKTIGEYQIVKTLSQDNVTITLLGWKQGQSLILRTLNLDKLDQPAVLTAFQQQAEQLLKFDYTGIPKFIDFFSVEGQPYLVREQVYGQDLNQRVATYGPLAPAEAIDLVVQVCHVLDYLHQQSPPFLHQDLKPDNLIKQTLIPNVGKIAVVGLASLREFTTEMLTVTGYTAPEQQQGHPTVASDLFSLGPLLAYLLTGQEPNSFYAHREQGYRLYPEYVPGLPPELVAVVRRLTSPEPEDRYLTAKAVAEALHQAASAAEKL